MEGWGCPGDLGQGTKKFPKEIGAVLTCTSLRIHACTHTPWTVLTFTFVYVCTYVHQRFPGLFQIIKYMHVYIYTQMYIVHCLDSFDIYWFAKRLTSERAQREPGAFKQSWRTLSHTESKTDSSTNTHIQTITPTHRQRCQRSKKPGRSNSLVLALSHTESKTDTLGQIQPHRHRH